MKKARLTLLALAAAAASGAAPATAQTILPRAGEVLFSHKIKRGVVGDQFGRSVDLLGDLDDDGVPDLVVGASHDDDGAENSGAIWILFMNADRTPRSHVKISQTQGGFTGTLGDTNWFGKDLEALGDLDGDGIEDVAVGAPADDIPDDRAVYILFLNTDGTVREHTRIARTTREFGRSITQIGDLDGDGVKELVIGNGFGTVYLYYMNADGTAKSSKTYNARTDSTPGFDSFYGLGSGRIGDFDNDGIGDIAIGDTAADHGGTDSGTVWLSLVSSSGTDKQEIPLYDGAPGLGLNLPSYPNFGRDVALLDDLDGNGVRDIAIGCSEYHSGNEPVDSGAVFVVFLNSDGTARDHRKISRRHGNLGQTLRSFNEFGISLAPIGDWNADGVTDLVVGARFDGSGAIYLLMMNDGTVEPVTARAMGDPRVGPAPLTVQFTDTSTGSVTGWLWDFGDGNTSTEQHPSHTYLLEGLFDVTLTVTGPGDISDTRLYTGVIDVQAPTVSVAGFSAEPIEGVPPLEVAFTDQSVGSISSWDWDFGDGGSSTAQSPSHTYTSPGSYDPMLTVDGSTGSDTAGLVSGPIVVHEALPPTAGFSSSAPAGTVPFTVDFQDESTGFVESRLWDFGDGGMSILESPSHEYLQPGTYTVSLTVTNGIGSDTLTRADYVVASLPPVPVANFGGSPTSGPTPLAVTFTDQSTGGPTSWSWDFGDGQASSLQNPVHTYTTGGSFDVSLTVSNAAGSDIWTLQGLVSAVQTIDITPLNDGILSQDSASGTGYIMYTAEPVHPRFGGALLQWEPADHFITVKSISGVWHYDDNLDYQVLSPRSTDRLIAAVDFSADTVQLLQGPLGTIDGIASGYTGGDLDIVPNQWQGGFNDGEFGPSGTFITVGGGTPAPTPAFDATPTQGVAPLEVDFTDLSTGGPTAWTWDFGDGGSSSEQNPTHTYASPGTYSVSLTASNAGGSNTLAMTDLVLVTVPAPTADFGADVTSGIAPLAVQFTDLSTGSPTAWTWDFGDGSSSTEQSPSHTYVNPGSYTVSLTASNAGGSDTYTLPTQIDVTAGPPTANASASTTGGPSPLFVQFTDLSTGTPTSWSWDFGDGNSSSEQNPGHVYFMQGSFTVSLTATNAGGSDTFTLPSPIVVTPPPPVADFTADVTSGPAPLQVQLTDLSTGSPTSWSWDFGDGNGSTEQSPAHTYTDPGSYTVSLTATNAGGSDTYTLPTQIEATPPAPTADFTADVTSGPAPLLVQFTDLSTGSPTSWDWDFGDGGSSTEQSPAHTYADPGSYTVSLTATNAGGSNTFTLATTIDVAEAPPTAEFTADVTSGPEPLQVQFTDLSAGAPTSWDWDFGDGNTSTEQNPAHSYAEGTYTVSLTVMNASGSDSYTLPTQIVAGPPLPVASFDAAPTSGTAPLLVQLTDLSTGSPASWDWDFGDGNSSTEQSPAHTYTDPGSYTVSLTVMNASGSDTFTLPSPIVAAAPVTADFSADVTAGPAPLLVQFTDLSTGSPTSWDWDFGDGNTSSEQNPAHAYGEGTFTVSLSVTGPTGSDSITRSDLITVGSVQVGIGDGSFELSPLGGLPGAPWTVVLGGAHRVLPDGFASDLAMPTDGGRWLELSADGSSASTPPDSPGGPTTPAVGGAGIRQSFTYPDGFSQLMFDASFLLDGNVADAAFNDWMSVDLSDGTTTWNLFYRDTFSLFDRTSQAYGLPMTKIQRVGASLSQLFPGSTPQTVFVLTIQVGNGGDGLRPSMGYVDRIRLEPGAEVRPVGCGVNAAGSMVVTGSPTLGSDVFFDLDNPEGTQCVGSTAVTLYVALAPDPTYPPCGTLLAGYGMVLGMDGENLTGWMNPANRFTKVTAPAWAGPGSPTTAVLHIPGSMGAIGLELYAQGLFVDTTSSCGTRFGLTEAVRLIVGP